jgi:hypothetical protein
MSLKITFVIDKVALFIMHHGKKAYKWCESRSLPSLQEHLITGKMPPVPTESRLIGDQRGIEEKNPCT